ncbi:MAG: peptidylprolyl isomerase, partial [Candidatus Zixiibacteriota bacterium]
MKKLITLAALSAIAILAAMAGCSDSGSDVIARVDDKDLTADDFELYAGNMRIAFPSAEEEFAKKREILDSMVVMELLIRAAYEKNIDKSEEVARVVLANRPRFLLDALYSKEVVEKTDVTDAEISLFYDRLEFKMRAFQVLVDDEDTAQMIFERLKEGADIEQMAFEYSTDPSAKRNRGDVGYFVWGAMVDEFQEACLAMEIGELSPPVKSTFGYHIIKLVDKAPNEARTSFEEMKESIRRQILNRKRSTLTQEYFTMIREKYPIVIDPAPCEYVLHKREGLYPPQLLKNLPRSDFDLEQLDRDERELVLATWEGGQVSIGEYLALIQNVPVQYRPDLDDYDSLEVIVFELKKQDILVYEAILQGMESNEGFQR